MGTAIIAVISRLAPQSGGLRSSLLANQIKLHTFTTSREKPEAPGLYTTATLDKAPSVQKSTNGHPPPSAEPSESADSAVSTQTPNLPRAHEASPSTSGDLKDSARRLDTIDAVSAFADQLFNAEPTFEPSQTVNQQGLDQQDYRLDDGTAITTWSGQDDGSGSGPLRAQEAQLPNGEVVDRWFHDNGAVQQVMHTYDANHSISVYYYENGQTEAMRIIQNGREIFMRYDRDGRLIEKTIN